MRTHMVTIGLVTTLCMSLALTAPYWARPIARDRGAPAVRSRGTPAARNRGAPVAGDRGVPAAWDRSDGEPARSSTPPRGAWLAVVLRVIDGDTVILLARGRAERVRLIGVDAPETWSRHDCFGVEATRALRALLPRGSPVRAAGDREAFDRYGRRLLYLWAPYAPQRGHAVRPGRSAVGARDPTSTFVATSLIREGFARAMYVPPNTRYLAALDAAQAVARRSHAGVWASCERR
jgi:endonuclease YncB( thermonuclease family)